MKEIQITACKFLKEVQGKRVYAYSGIDTQSGEAISGHGAVDLQNITYKVDIKQGNEAYPVWWVPEITREMVVQQKYGELSAYSGDHFTPDQIDTLVGCGVIQPDTPQPMIKQFFHVCAKYDYDPFTKEIHLAKIDGKFTPIVDRSGRRKKISQTGENGGQDEALFDGVPIHQWEKEHGPIEWRVKGKYPRTCSVTIYRIVQGQKASFTHTVVFDEKDKGVKSKFWRESPTEAIIKCAEAGAQRAGFSDALGRVYAPEEADAVTVVSVDEEAIRAEFETCTAEGLKDLVKRCDHLAGEDWFIDCLVSAQSRLMEESK